METDVLTQQIIAGARQSFLDGADWAYLAGVIAVLLGAALVAWRFPKHDKELELLERYRDEDAPTHAAG